MFMLGLEIEAWKPPRNDLKMVSVIEMTFLYDAQYSIVLERILETNADSVAGGERRQRRSSRRCKGGSIRV